MTMVNALAQIRFSQEMRRIVPIFLFNFASSERFFCFQHFENIGCEARVKPVLGQTAGAFHLNKRIRVVGDFREKATPR